MNKIINQYLLFNYIKIVFNSILIFFSLGIILNLFEEIEFFKNTDQSLSLPIILSLSFVPSLIIELMPFIIFLASMFYFLHLKNNKDLLSVKIFGYSNLRITLIVSFFAFMFGCFILIAVNPITSTLIKYYEAEKSKHSRDVDHLISVNKNGVWIKEVNEDGYKIINASKIQDNTLKNVSIYVFNKKNKIIKRIEAKTAMITENPWQMNEVVIYNFVDESKNYLENYEFETEKILDQINSVYRNLNTLSFVNLLNNYDELNIAGYSSKLLNEKIHKFISLPFFLFLMVVLASIFSIGTINTKQNYYYVILSIFTSVVIFYFKDLSIALGQTGKISLVTSVWIPVVSIGLFCLIGVIQINER